MLKESIIKVLTFKPINMKNRECSICTIFLTTKAKVRLLSVGEKYSKFCNANNIVAHCFWLAFYTTQRNKTTRCI